ncbi:MAG: aspartate aminotransferase family protein [Armatimonadetes bacterium]|nr:aspartate aminotransferase family protein [Armatimonadota bacterium]
MKNEIPGKNSRKLNQIKEEYIPQGVFNVVPVFIKKAQGVFLYDYDNNKFLDFASGLGVMNLGHTHPGILKAVKKRLGDYQHLCFHVAMYPEYLELAKALAEITPGDFNKKVILLNSGAEAVENAFKVSRTFTKRRSVISFEGAFHGRTMFALSLTSKIYPYKKNFGPFFGDVYKIPYAYCYRCYFNLNYPDCGIYCLEFLEKIFKTQVDPEDIAALIIEPIIGEGGFIVPPLEFLEGISEITRKSGILYIDDEIQAGLGRTGKIWAISHFKVIPDIILSAKALGGGLPLSAVIGRKEIMDSTIVGGLGGTFGGNPISCQAGLTMIKEIKKDKLMKSVEKNGEYILNYLKKLKEEFSLIGDIRGKGLMLAIELVKNQKTKEPAIEETARIIKYCYQNGLILLKAGIYDNVIRFLPPLIIKEEEIEQGLKILRGAFKKAI